MRHLPRLLVFLLCALLAFWFTAENADEIVRIDFALLRIRASLPLVVFGSMLIGMIATLVVGWRADRRTRELLRHARRPRRAAGPESGTVPRHGPERGPEDDARRPVRGDRHEEPVG